MRVNALIFDRFLELDLFGAAAIFKNLNAQINYLSLSGGLIKGASSAEIHSTKAAKDEITKADVLLLPGGAGVREVIDDSEFIALLRQLCDKSTYVLSVCTSSALLARAGLLKNRRASTNHAAFSWVSAQDMSANWSHERYSKDGKYYTSAGVSAGIDMTLAFVRDILGVSIALDMAHRLEYEPRITL